MNQITDAAQRMYKVASDMMQEPGIHVWFSSPQMDYIMEDIDDQHVYIECLDTQDSDIIDASNLSMFKFVVTVRDFVDECEAAA